MVSNVVAASMIHHGQEFGTFFSCERQRCMRPSSGGHLITSQVNHVTYGSLAILHGTPADKNKRGGA